MVKVTVLSRAKINLMLRIVGRRIDGYHNLQTYFQLLEWGDHIEFECTEVNGSNQVEITGFPGLSKQDNLIFKAANALMEFAQNKSDWVIDVKKHIPKGAGLGGGSSNAAETLKMLNIQWDCGLSQSKLIKIGKSLGADVPVFIAGQSSLATGIGDDLEDMDFKTTFVLLFFPEISVCTATLFNHPKLSRDQVELERSEMFNRDLWINDFFPLLLQQNAEIKSVYEQLKTRIDVRLSGTGSTMYALYADESEAKTAEKWSSQWVRSLLVKPKINR